VSRWSWRQHAAVRKQGKNIVYLVQGEGRASVRVHGVAVPAVQLHQLTIDGQPAIFGAKKAEAG
jgi:hypothetical protein